MIKGKCIIFVSDIDRCYRLKLFFEQFGIRSCILNSELPLNSRVHVVEEFNRNVYDIIIAADEKHAMLGDKEEVEEEDEAEETKEDAKNPEDGEDDTAEKETPRPKKKSKPSKADKEYGVSRGMNRPSQLSPSMSRVSVYILLGSNLYEETIANNGFRRCRFQEGVSSHQL